MKNCIREIAALKAVSRLAFAEPTTAGVLGVRIKGNTDLKGGVIASSDAAVDNGLNSLTTGTLSYSDIANSSNYDAKSSGISAGASMGLPDKVAGPASVPNSGGITPALSQHDSGSESATTRSGVSAGAINITDADHQTQDVASLNRDTSDPNGMVTKTPDLNNLLERQADMMSAASAAGQAVATQIGNYADRRLQEARDAGDQAGIAAWSEGGSARVAMHTAGGALVAGLGGGNALGGAAGAATSAVLAGHLNDISNAVTGANPTGDADANRTLGNILANALAGSAGGLVGGNSGSFSGANVDLYNARAHCDNGSCEGGTGSVLSGIGGWIADQFASAGRGAQNMGNQFAALVNANGPQEPYVDPNDLSGPGSGHPPTASGGGAVVTPPVVACGPAGCVVSPPVAVPGTAGYVPSNATISSGNGDNEAGGNGSGDVNLASPDRTSHILTGDSTGGGHQWPGGPGKSVFPENWSASKIMNTVSDIATDPSIPETVQANGRIVKNGSRDGIDIRVVIEPASKGGGIVTAFPTNVPRNPK